MFRLVLVCERQAGQFLVDHQQSLSEKSEHMMCYYCQLLWRTHITMSMHNDVYMLYILVVKRRESTSHKMKTFVRGKPRRMSEPRRCWYPSLRSFITLCETSICYLFFYLLNARGHSVEYCFTSRALLYITRIE